MNPPLLLSCFHNSCSMFCSFSWHDRAMQVKLNGEVMLSGRKITSEVNKQLNLINKFSTRSSWSFWMPNLHFLVQQKPKTSGHKACTTHHRTQNLGLAISSFKWCIKLTEKKCTWCITLDHLHFSHRLGWRVSWAPRAPRYSGTVWDSPDSVSHVLTALRWSLPDHPKASICLPIYWDI